MNLLDLIELKKQYAIFLEMFTYPFPILLRKIGDGKCNFNQNFRSRSQRKNPKANKKEITLMIQADKSAVQTAFTDKVNLFKEELTEKYFLTKQTALDDYPIFMAIT